jgi:translation initiation factor IF-2
MEAARLDADATVARARAYAQIRERLPRETAERLRTLVAGGLRPTFAPMAQGGPRDGEMRREGDVRRPDAPREGDRRPAEGEFRRPAAPREGEGFRRPAEGDRGPRPDGDRGPRVDGDRGPRPDGDRGRNPEGGDRRPELPRRPPADQ